MNLVLHFFAVAIYGVGRLMLPLPSLKRIWTGAGLISVGNSMNFESVETEFLINFSSKFCFQDRLVWKQDFLTWLTSFL